MLEEIKALHPFRDMDGAGLATAARHASWVRLPAERWLRRRGQTLARELYLMVGSVAGEEGGSRRTLHARDTGGKALSAHFAATAALATATPATLIAVDLAAVRSLLDSGGPRRPAVAGVEEWMDALLHGPVMRWFSPGAWAQVLRSGRKRDAASGERIVRMGEVCATVYVVARGAAVAGKQRFEPGDFFAEESTLSQRPAASDVAMATAGTLVCFDRADLLALAANYEPPRLEPPPRRIDLDAVDPAEEPGLLATLAPGPAVAVRCRDPARRLTVATRLMRQGFHVV